MVDVPGSHSHGPKGIITRLREMHCMCQVLGQHKHRSDQISREDLPKGHALRVDRQITPGLAGSAKGEGGIFGGDGKQGGGTATCV